jgi:hypothetical protein
MFILLAAAGADSSHSAVAVGGLIAMDTLPTDVQDTLHARAGQEKIVTVESNTKHDKLA